jgi:hypothetical protein
MDVKVTVDSNWFKLAGKLKFPKKIVAQESLKAMEETATFLRREVMLNAIEVGAVDTGKFVSSIEKKVKPFEAVIFSELNYAYNIERGRKPGTMPPEGALIEWMIRHDIPLEAEYAIRLKIKKQGIEARPVFEPALTRGKRIIERSFQAAGKRMVLRLFGAY